ncbi:MULTISPECIES: MFS transporter [unclassified Bacillus cereus group]|uniref:MFS transporter n=1 Tax=unclassified Bacillus cereus group TaxID=2750818 RepID=UPI0028C4559D|nr:MFS transporter [Bacillus cereus group sp. BfR-BA-01430]
MIIYTETVGFICITLICAYTWIYDSIPLWQLVLLHIIGFFYHSFQIPCVIAIAQEITSSEDYKKVSSLLEIQSQTSSLAGAGLAILALTYFKIQHILLFDALSFLICILMMMVLRYQPNKRNSIKTSNYISFLLPELPNSKKSVASNVSSSASVVRVVGSNNCFSRSHQYFFNTG